MDKIVELRKQGLGYKKIASMLNMNINTVKSICQKINTCKLCGDPIDKGSFCSNKCRMKWWYLYGTKKNTVECAHCHKTFKTQYKNRKYCSHECYIKGRYGDVNE